MSDELIRQVEQIAEEAAQYRRMGERSEIYEQQISHVVHALFELATDLGFPCLLIVQTSDVKYELTGNVPWYTNDDLRGCFTHWLQGSQQQEE